MLRSAQPSQFSTYPSQYIDTPGLAVLFYTIGGRPFNKTTATLVKFYLFSTLHTKSFVSCFWYLINNIESRGRETLHLSSDLHCWRGRASFTLHLDISLSSEICVVVNCFSSVHKYLPWWILPVSTTTLHIQFYYINVVKM